MQTFVPHQIAVHGKRPSTDGAGELALRVMDVHMPLEVCSRRKPSPTDSTFQRRPIVMHTLVLTKVALVCKRLPAAGFRTHKRFLLRVRDPVPEEVPVGAEFPAAYRAGEWACSGVNPIT